MSKCLISLPYIASTNNYSKYFPFPLALLKYMKQGDDLFDLNLLAYQKKKEEVYAIIDNFINSSDKFEQYDEILVQVGDYAPDGDKYEFFEYFLERFKHPVKLLGPYCIFEKRIARYKFSTIKELYTNTYGVMIPEEMIMQYPNADNVKRTTMRLSNGCPRGCKMCPVPIIHSKKYKMEAIEPSLKMVQEYYDMGVRLITFIDDNIGVNIKKFKKFLQQLKEMNLKGMKFVSLEGFETYMFQDEEICQLLKDTKWLNIKTGMENINEDFLKKIDKYYTNHAVIVKAMENIRKYKLDVSVYFLIGLDETADVVMDNIRFLSKYRLGVRVNILRPYENGLLDFNSFTRKMEMKTMKHLSSLAYAVSWLGTNHDIDMFDENAFEQVLEKCKLKCTIEGNLIIFTGKVYIGFKTSKLIKVLTYLLNQKYTEIKRFKDDKQKIIYKIIKQSEDVSILFE